jgi:ribosome maturation factor RimP
MADIARITEIVEGETRALGHDLVRVVLYGKSEVGDEERTLQVMAERPETGQLLIDDCAALSHRISDRLDALEEAGEVLIEGAYRLEVSSPGIDRPLTRPKDFLAWTGHEARIELRELTDKRKRFRGTLAGFDPATNTISIEEDAVVYTVPFALVDNAKLILTDKLIAASRPVDMTGADTIVEEQED